MPRDNTHDTETILVVEDDPALREALALLFKNEGYDCIVARDGAEVAALLDGGLQNFDLIIADYNLPGGKTGLEVIADLRKARGSKVPAIVLTGDISTEVLRKVIASDCERLHKPVNVTHLIARIEALILRAHHSPPRDLVRAAPGAAPAQAKPTVFIVDDDEILLGSLREMLEHRGYVVEIYASADAFLDAYGGRRGCLVVDSVMPHVSGLDLLERLKAEDRQLPSILITGYGDISMAIRAMKAGAMDFIEKPTQEAELIASIDRALLQAEDTAKHSISQMAAAASIAALSLREREVMKLVVEGLPNKQIAFNLNISQRTVETHRAAVMSRTGSESLPDLIRLVMRAGYL